MWSTCKVVQHVHAAGALVHQAAQARPLPARFCGGLGLGAGAGAPGGDASAAGAAWRASARACLEYQQLLQTFLFYKNRKT